jgi:hypothetical protein
MECHSKSWAEIPEISDPDTEFALSMSVREIVQAVGAHYVLIG